MENIFFKYREISSYVPVEMEKLRPKGAYKFLLKNRNHNLESLLINGELSSEYLKKRNCPLCMSCDSSSVMKKDGFEIVKCSECELTYVSQILDGSFYEETYASEKYASVVSMLGYESHPYRKERFGVERVRKLAQYWDRQEPPSLLDVGCSTGFVVHAATERGWSARGIDLNQHAINFGKKKFDLRLSEENFFDINEHFDFIGMYDVLEHVPDPISFLQHAFERLNRSGCIHIYVPNWNSASRYVLDCDAHFIWPSHHLTYFTPKTLARMVESVGFTVLEMETEGLDFFDIRWMKHEGFLKEQFDVSERILNIIQFLANAGGHGKNLRCIARKIE